MKHGKENHDEIYPHSEKAEHANSFGAELAEHAEMHYDKMRKGKY